MRAEWQRLLRLVVMFAVVVGLVTGYRLAGRPSWAGPVSIGAILGFFLAAGLLAIVVHLLGHLLAARACGFRANAVYGRGCVAGPGSSARLALVSAAGPLANLLLAGALTPWVWRAWPPAVTALASATTGLADLVPDRSVSGQPTDGLTLWRSLRVALAPAGRRAEADILRLLDQPDWQLREEAADRLMAGYQCGVPEARRHRHHLAALLRQAGRVDDLLRVHAMHVALTRAPKAMSVREVHQVEWAVLTVPGIPKKTAHLAARRVRWVVAHHPRPRAAAQHTMALALLRQGRSGKVERLCAPVLAAELWPSERATVLATIALARHALGQEARPALEAALALDPAADLVEEAASTIATSSPRVAAP